MSENANTPVALTVSQIINDLETGHTRAQIQSKYGLSNKDLTALFQHPKLKGRKTKAAPGFILTDDTEIENVTQDLSSADISEGNFTQESEDSFFEEEEVEQEL